MYVKEITSTIKGHRKAELGPLTLILGENGSGKSAVINGLEALFGSPVSDVAGRSGFVASHKLMELVPPDKNLEVTATFDTGESCSLTIERKKRGGNKEPERKGKPPAYLGVRFPVKDIEDNLTGSADGGQKFLLGVMGAAITREQILEEIPQVLHETYNNFASGFKGSEGEILSAVWAHAKKEATAESKRLKALAEEIRVQRSSLGPQVTPEMIEEWRAEYHQADRNWRDLSDLLAAQARPDKTRDAVESLLREGTAFLENLTREERRLLEILSAPPTDPAKADMAAAAAHTCQNSNKGFCLSCGRPASPKVMEHRAREWGDLLGTLVHRVDSSMSTASAQAQLELTQATRKHYESKIAEYSEQLKTFSDGESAPRAPVTQEAVDAERDKVAESRLRLLRAESNARSWEEVRAAQLRLRSGEDSLVMLERLVSVLNKVAVSLLNQAVASFSAQVQSRLPDTDKFGLEVETAQGGSTCRFGLYHGDVLHTALSGAEWARVTLAMASAVAKKGYFNLFVLPDRAFSPKTLGAVLNAIASNPPDGQVLVASPINPLGGDWTHVSVDSRWTILDLYRLARDENYENALAKIEEYKRKGGGEVSEPRLQGEVEPLPEPVVGRRLNNGYTTTIPTGSYTTTMNHIWWTPPNNSGGTNG